MAAVVLANPSNNPTAILDQRLRDVKNWLKIEATARNELRKKITAEAKNWNHPKDFSLDELFPLGIILRTFPRPPNPFTMMQRSIDELKTNQLLEPAVIAKYQEQLNYYNNLRMTPEKQAEYRAVEQKMNDFLYNLFVDNLPKFYGKKFNEYIKEFKNIEKAEIGAYNRFPKWVNGFKKNITNYAKQLTVSNSEIDRMKARSSIFNFSEINGPSKALENIQNNSNIKRNKLFNSFASFLGNRSVAAYIANHINNSYYMERYKAITATIPVNDAYASWLNKLVATVIAPLPVQQT